MSKHEGRDEKGRFLPGVPAPVGHRFSAEDGSAQAGQAAGTRTKHEKKDLRRLCQIWLETDVATGDDGKPLTGGQMMVQMAAKEIAKGNARFWELMRDTAGFKPVDRVMVAEVDPSVVAEVEEIVREASDE